MGCIDLHSPDSDGGIQMNIQVNCDWCGKPIVRRPSWIHRHNFCCRECFANYSSKTKNPEGYRNIRSFAKDSERMTRMNRELNPTRMTPEIRKKLRESMLKKERCRTCKRYRRKYGKKEHRVVAEEMLGRPLRPGEVVHHIDGNRLNNSPENIYVFSSAAEHTRFHAALRRAAKRKAGQGGDAE